MARLQLVGEEAPAAPLPASPAPTLVPPAPAEAPAPAPAPIAETQLAASARAMVERGDWLIPHVNGLPRYDKPPLVYWLMGSVADRGMTEVGWLAAALLLGMGLLWSQRRLLAALSLGDVVAGTLGVNVRWGSRLVVVGAAILVGASVAVAGQLFRHIAGAYAMVLGPHEARLLAALAHGMPACAGVALGVDRLLMAMLDTPRIADVVAFDFARA